MRGTMTHESVVFTLGINDRTPISAPTDNRQSTTGHRFCADRQPPMSNRRAKMGVAVHRKRRSLDDPTTTAPYDIAARRTTANVSPPKMREIPPTRSPLHVEWRAEHLRRPTALNEKNRVQYAAAPSIIRRLPTLGDSFTYGSTRRCIVRRPTPADARRPFHLHVDAWPYVLPLSPIRRNTWSSGETQRINREKKTHTVFPR